MMSISVGPELNRLIRTAFEADLPVMLHGMHGVGKSEGLEAAAKAMGIGCIVRDLSVMEPPDLIGLPIVRDARTYYAAPSFLPYDGQGLLVFEELNRAPSYMRAPTMQLLTARRLNDYVLPRGWLPVAAVNDAEDGYHVDQLDPALMARFTHVRLEPRKDQWLTWAREHGIHGDVVSFVDASQDVFSSPTSNPRAWTYAARAVEAWDRQRGSVDDLAVLLSGVLDEVWANAFIASLGASSAPLKATQILDEYSAWQGTVRKWRSTGRLDLLRATWTKLRGQIQASRRFMALLADSTRKSNVERFFADVDAELRSDICDFLDERNLRGLQVGA